MPSTAFRPPWPSSSAPAAAAARAPWPRSPRSITSCDCCIRSWARSSARPATCPSSRRSAASIAERLLKQHKGSRILLMAPLVVARKGYYTELAKWANKRGYKQLRVDGEMLTTYQWPRLNRFKEHTIELPVAQINVQKDIRRFAGAQRHQGAGSRQGPGTRAGPRRQAAEGAGVLHQARLSLLRHQLLRARSAPVLVQFQTRLVRGLLRHRPAARGLRRGAERRGNRLERTAGGRDPQLRDLPRPTAEPDRAARDASATSTSPSSRARPSTTPWRSSNKLRLSKREAEIARDLMAEIKSRMAFLQRVGLGYLPLDRSAPTLSGGEAQRIRLAAQLGSNLQGVCYVLDEPTIGLHPRDNQRAARCAGRAGKASQYADRRGAR